MIGSVFLIVICLFFPLLLYFLYLVYSKCSFEEEKQIFLDLALFSSFYLMIKFCNISLNFIWILNIPILISFYYKKNKTGMILSIIMILILKYKFDINLLFSTINYSFSIIFIFLLKKHILNIFVIFNILFNTFFLISGSINLSNFLIASSLPFFFYTLIIFIFSKIENTINMYYSLKEISREKKLYESLFKITHEIKNPLAVCKGYLDMFDANDIKKSKKYINVINEEINRTLLLLKDFSDISKINVEKSLIDINLLLEDVCEEVSLAFNSNIEFTWVLPNEELMIEADYNRLKQVFINIIKNAKESILNNGKVVLTTKMIKGNYLIIIKDNGIGMDEETVKKIGQAFYTTKKNGTGLGVCLSKEIVTKHNGLIKYSSKKNKGTTVKIILPVKNI